MSSSIMCIEPAPLHLKVSCVCVCVHWQFWTEQDKIQKANSEARIAYEIQRRLQPQTEADFDVLNKELETWQNAVEFQTLNLFQTVVTMLEILFLEGETRLHIRFAANILYATARQTQNLGIERLISYS